MGFGVHFSDPSSAAAIAFYLERLEKLFRIELVPSNGAETMVQAYWMGETVRFTDETALPAGSYANRYVKFRDLGFDLEYRKMRFHRSEAAELLQCNIPGHFYHFIGQTAEPRTPEEARRVARSIGDCRRIIRLAELDGRQRRLRNYKGIPVSKLRQMARHAYRFTPRFQSGFIRATRVLSTRKKVAIDPAFLKIWVCERESIPYLIEAIRLKGIPVPAVVHRLIFGAPSSWSFLDMRIAVERGLFPAGPGSFMPQPPTRFSSVAGFYFDVDRDGNTTFYDPNTKQIRSSRSDNVTADFVRRLFSPLMPIEEYEAELPPVSKPQPMPKPPEPR